MKIIDEHGNPIENPDMTKGYLKQETQTAHHDAVAGVEEVSHYEYKTYPNGGKDRWKVVDVPGVDPRPAWDEEVPVMRYIRYTPEELAEQKKARKEAEEKAQLPTAEERLAALEAAMLDLLAAQ